MSTDPKTNEVSVDEYFSYSEGIMHKFPGYQLDENNLVENISDSEINLEKHIELLLSKNVENIPKHLFGGQARFLCGAPFQAISYTSYPRSGNTFLRKYLENITGVATGSD